MFSDLDPDPYPKVKVTQDI